MPSKNDLNNYCSRVLSAFGKQQKNLAAALLLIFSLELLLLSKFIFVNIDSGWIAEPAHNFAESGVIALKTWTGFQHLEQHVYWWPPLFFVVEGIFFKFAGFSLWSVSIFNAGIALTALLVTGFLASRLYGKGAAPLAMLVVMGSFQFASNSIFHNRPETLVGISNLISAYWIIKYSSSGSWRHAAAAAAFAALSFLLHPIGALMIASVFAMILINHRKHRHPTTVKNMVLAAIVAIFILLPWVIYASEDIEAFNTQWQWTSSKGTTLEKTIASEYVRYEWLLTTNNGVKVPLFLMLLFTIGLYLRSRELKSAATIIALHIILFVFVASKTTSYFDVITPLMAVYLAGEIIRNVSDMKIRCSALALVLGSSAFSIAALAGYTLMMSPDFNFPDTFNYLSEKNYSKVIAQPAYYYAFGERMYSSEAIVSRLNGGETLAGILTDVDADYYIYDPIVQEVSLPPEMKPLLAQSKLQETICVKGRILIASNEECASNRFRVEIYRLK